MTKRVDETIEEYRARDAKRAREWREIRRTTNREGEIVGTIEALVDRPDPVRINGVVKRTSTYTGADGRVGQWVIEEPAKAAAALAWKIALEEATKGIVPFYPEPEPVPCPSLWEAKDMLTEYPVGDHHMGMYSWHAETGADYDVDTGERILVKAMTYLVKRAPASDQALITFLGDLMHYDSFQPITPRGKNVLDSDTRLPRIIRHTLRMIRTVVRLALQKHQHVHVIFEPGNHDPASTPWITELFAMLYENEPRVTIDTSPRHFHYYHFGQVVIATHHGDKVKLDKLPMIMAEDIPQVWGQTRHRYWHTGHVHHEQKKAFGSVIVESFAILPPPDAFSHENGYRSKREMKMIAYHRNTGERDRVTVTPEMIGE